MINGEPIPRRRKTDLGDWGMSREFPHTRYERDPQFHMLVDMLEVEIERGNYTPTELREACYMAACFYEYRHIRPAFIDAQEPFKWNIKPMESHDEAAILAESYLRNKEPEFCPICHHGYRDHKIKGGLDGEYCTIEGCRCVDGHL